MTIDVDKLKKALMDYYGPAAFNGFPMATYELGQIENASFKQLLKLAEEAGIDITDYAIDDYEDER